MRSFRSERWRAAQPPWQRLDAREEYECLCRLRLDHIVPVSEPLVLVSQIERSGGTLLSQLFDGHPECHSHAYELRVGSPKQRIGLALDIAAPDGWFGLLYEKHVGGHFRRGYRKSPEVLPSEDAEFDVFPFIFLPRLQHLLFEKCVRETTIESRRDVLDCYFTSYFNAWIDNRNLYTGPKKAVTAFAPDLNLRPDSVRSFFEDYPDGKLVSIVRDPCSWYASARSQKKKYADVDFALAKWRRSTEAILEWRKRYGDRVIALTYEDLVLDTAAVMARIAEQIGISMSPTLLVPTFNGRPIRANSSFHVERHGILADRASPHHGGLNRDTIARIEDAAGDLYAHIRGDLA